MGGNPILILMSIVHYTSRSGAANKKCACRCDSVDKLNKPRRSVGFQENAGYLGLLSSLSIERRSELVASSVLKAVSFLSHQN